MGNKKYNDEEKLINIHAVLTKLGFSDEIKSRCVDIVQTLEIKNKDCTIIKNTDLLVFNRLLPLYNLESNIVENLIYTSFESGRKPCDADNNYVAIKYVEHKKSDDKRYIVLFYIPEFVSEEVR